MALLMQHDDDWIPESTFGTRLVIIRRDLNLSQEEAAEKCAVNASTWATWELGRSPRDKAAVADKIRKGLGVNRDWLMWGGQPDSRWQPNDAALNGLPAVLGQLDLPFLPPADLVLVAH